MLIIYKRTSTVFSWHSQLRIQVFIHLTNQQWIMKLLLCLSRILKEVSVFNRKSRGREKVEVSVQLHMVVKEKGAHGLREGTLLLPWGFRQAHRPGHSSAGSWRKTRILSAGQTCICGVVDRCGVARRLSVPWHMGVVRIPRDNRKDLSSRPTMFI